MPIEDTDVPQSPGWWLVRLSAWLSEPRRLRRLEKLKSYMDGNPPLPIPLEGKAFEAFKVFQKKARSNFARVPVEARRHRSIPVGIRTSADGDETGDSDAWSIVERGGLKVVFGDVIEMMLVYGEAYAIAGDLDEETGVPLVTAEDPREVVTYEDAATGRTIAGLKVFHDELNRKDMAYLYLPGKLYVASRPNNSCGPTIRVNAQGWDWESEQDLSGRIGTMLPVFKFRNRDDKGIFEPHLDILDRINHTIYQRVVIATLQAFRRYAAIGLPATWPAGHPNAGQEIDYGDVLTADPGAVWMLPDGADIWESGQVDLTPILSSIKDDIRDLSSIMDTPMYMFMPDSVNMAATGVSAAREGLVFSVRDMLDRQNVQFSRLMSMCFRWLGDAERADLQNLRVMWADPDMPSAAERAQVASQATDVPWRTKMTKLWGFSPDEVDRMEAERAADRLDEATFNQAVIAAVDAQAARETVVENTQQINKQNSQQQGAGQVQKPSRLSQAVNGDAAAAANQSTQ